MVVLLLFTTQQQQSQWLGNKFLNMEDLSTVPGHLSIVHHSLNPLTVLTSAHEKGDLFNSLRYDGQHLAIDALAPSFNSADSTNHCR